MGVTYKSYGKYIRMLKNKGVKFYINSGMLVVAGIEEKLGETLSVGSIQSSLKRMEEKGFLTSAFGESTGKRGGKRKRIYTATPYAHSVLNELKDIRTGLWEAMTQPIISFISL